MLSVLLHDFNEGHQYFILQRNRVLVLLRVLMVKRVTRTDAWRNNISAFTTALTSYCASVSLCHFCIFRRARIHYATLNESQSAKLA
jgi:hypothetical protein